jgi:Sec-independent protein translocase protein TatA
MELLFILIIILLVVGPKDIANTARNTGRFLNKLNRSPNYQAIRRASEELRNLPQRLAQEAQLDELKELEKQVEKELQDTANTISDAQKPFQAWVKDMTAPMSKDGVPAPTPPAGPPQTTVAAPTPAANAAISERTGSTPATTTPTTPEANGSTPAATPPATGATTLESQPEPASPPPAVSETPAKD